eukprot:753246-Hanusia_phi.AAC.3
MHEDSVRHESSNRSTSASIEGSSRLGGIGVSLSLGVSRDLETAGERTFYVSKLDRLLFLPSPVPPHCVHRSLLIPSPPLHPLSFPTRPSSCLLYSLPQSFLHPILLSSSCSPALQLLLVVGPFSVPSLPLVPTFNLSPSACRFVPSVGGHRLRSWEDAGKLLLGDVGEETMMIGLRMEITMLEMEMVM